MRGCAQMHRTTRSPFSSAKVAARPPVRKLVVVCKESRIGRLPVAVPSSVQYELEGKFLRAKGPLGTLEHSFSDLVTLTTEEGTIRVRPVSETRQALSMHGLSRTIAYNIIQGVSVGFTKQMQMVGTGYRASITGNQLTLSLGYSLPRILTVPEGLKVTVERLTGLTISGASKQAVGDFCAEIRRQRPPEPYKGKGVRYKGEVIKLKEGKAAGGKKK